jgi:hypothetical protein
MMVQTFYARMERIMAKKGKKDDKGKDKKKKKKKKKK